MSKSYKVALAVDAVDYWIIEKDIDAIENITKADLHESVVTPDNTYLCVYWDDICWDMMQVRPLLKKLESFRRHSFSFREKPLQGLSEGRRAVSCLQCKQSDTHLLPGQQSNHGCRL